jgi:hypothetical protein
MNIKSLDVEGLLALRAQIDTLLGEKRGELEKMLARMGNGSNGVGNGRSETWSGCR